MDRLATSAALEREQLVTSLRAVAEGSRPALAEVYRRTSAKLFGICVRILGETGEAEEALQEVYLSVWRKADSFDPAKASPITWLAAMARNRAIDRRRALGARKATTLDEAMKIPDDSIGALEQLQAAEEGGRIAFCLDELEDRQNRAIRATFYEGLSYGELAAHWAVPLGTMKSWIRRGLLRLRDCLER